ncbi:MAG TPA: AAA family ATPase [Chloroflexota bacterium]
MTVDYQSLHQVGLSVLPLPWGQKAPPPQAWERYCVDRADDDQVDAWFANTARNVGVACGPASGGEADGLVVLVFNDDDLYGAFTGGEPPRTWVARSVRGPHVYVRINGDLPETTYWTSKRTRDLRVLEPRGTGAYVVAPDSQHPDGPRYEWVHQTADIVVLERDEFDDWFDRSLVAAESRGWTLEHDHAAGPTAAVDGEITDGGRNVTLTRMAGAMRRQGFDEDAIAVALLDTNARRCKPPLPDRTVRRIAQSVARYEPEPDGPQARVRGRSARAPSSGPDGKSYKLKTFANVRAEPLDWLWQGYLLYGTFSLLQGDPGLGKSLLYALVAACVSKGLWLPSDPRLIKPRTPEPADVIIMANEDDIARAIRPRLERAGADLNRVHMLEGVYDDDGNLVPPTLGDLRQIREALLDTGARVLLIDPLFGHLPLDLSPSRDKEVRHGMAPLIALAEELQVCVSGLRHLAKNPSLSFQNRGLESAAWKALARTELTVMYDPTQDEPGRKVLARSKGNLGREPKPLPFDILGEPDDDDAPPWLEFDDPLQDMDWLKLNQVAAAKAKSGGGSTAIGDAIKFLKARLGGGAELTATQIQDEADAEGFSESTLKRARRALKDQVQVRKRKDPSDGQTRWFWSMSASRPIHARVTHIGPNGLVHAVEDDDDVERF